MTDHIPASAREHLRVTVYTPESGLRSPLALIANMWRDALSPNCRDLAWRLVVRNVSATYRQSVGGILWMFIMPVFSAAVWIFLNSQNIINVEDAGMPYAVFVLTGNLVWAAFVSSLTSPTQSVRREMGMLTKLNFPREALLLAGFMELLLNSFVPMIILIPVFAYFKIIPTLGLAIAPFAVIAFLLFGYAIGLIVLPFALLFHDVERLIGIGAKLLFYLTPIIYPIPASGILHVVARFNPTTPFVVTTRELLTGQSVSMLPAFGWTTALVLIVLFVGLLMFRLAMPHVIERMSA